jgi:phenylacetate-CoA ligase
VKRALSRKNLWESAPRSVRAVAGSVLGFVPPKLLLGGAFRRQFAFVEAAQWWPRHRAEQYQLARLREVLHSAYHQTAYYRRTFDEAGFDPDSLKNLEDMGRLPFIDKAVLREHMDAMYLISPNSPGVDFVSTGGSSGIPLRFYIGADRSAIEYAYLVSSWGRVGYKLGDLMAVFRGRIVPETRDGLRHDFDPILRQHYYSNFHMTEENMRRYIEHVRTLGPCFLHVYPSAVATLGRFLRRSGLRSPDNVRAILAESEDVYPAERRLVEETFGCRYFSCYGHSEKLVLAAECQESTDYHVSPTYGYFELVDEQGRPVATPGEQGEIVGTGFINRVIPFIRYRTGDFATYVDDHCSACGRDHTLIRRIEGRWPSGELLTHDGALISMTALNVHDDTFDRVRQFQFYQDTPGRAILRVVPADDFDEQCRRRILEMLERKLESRVEVTIELMESIPLTTRGKMSYIDRREMPDTSLSGGAC